jgi:hypothetical protein
MWISKAHYSVLDGLINSSQDRNTEMLQREREYIGRLASMSSENAQLREQVARLTADQEWFKHRLTQIEKERAMLIHDRIGLRLPVPEFQPVTENPSDMLNHAVMPDLSIIGGDAPDGFNPAQELAPDYSALPSRANN